MLFRSASGNIGRRAVAALRDAGASVITTSRGRVDSGGREAIDFEADLLVTADREKLIGDAKATHLLHLAWYSDHGSFWTAPENIAWLSASADLLKRFADHGGRRAVVAGTCAEYDWNDLPQGVIPETASKIGRAHV